MVLVGGLVQETHRMNIVPGIHDMHRRAKHLDRFQQDFTDVFVEHTFRALTRIPSKDKEIHVSRQDENSFG
jgi:hypothetical protein